MKVLSKKLVRKPVQKRSLDKLNTILAVSKELFAKKNYFNVTTNEIAKEAGISIGTLYSYFSNKEEILSLILKDYNESFIVIFNQLNTSENLELFSSDYKGWIEKFIFFSSIKSYCHFLTLLSRSRTSYFECPHSKMV